MKSTHTKTQTNHIEWEVNYNGHYSQPKETFSNEGQEDFESLFKESSSHISTVMDKFVNTFRDNRNSNHPSFIKMAGLAVMIYFVGSVFYNNSSNPNADINVPVQLASMTSSITVSKKAVANTVATPSIVKPKMKQETFHTAAPVSIKKMIPANIETYINRYKKVAQAEMNKYGIPASISMAQAIIESKAGDSTLSNKNNNHFGMKCFSKVCSKGHCTNHGDDTHKDFFRKYNSPWESWRAHSKLLVGARYAKLQDHKLDYTKWAKGLQQQGYATDKNYSKKIIEVIKKYELYKLDKVS